MALLVSAFGLLWGFEDGMADLAVAHYFYDPVSRSFPLRHQWVLETLLHRGLKSVLVALWLATIAGCLWAMRGRLSWLPWQRAMGGALGLIFIPLVTTALKSVTNRHCPWSTDVFGGFSPYVGLLEQPPPDLVHGQCFPAGHASAGLAWIIWGFMLWDIAPRTARWFLGGALVLGMGMGFARMLQGAHFLSHMLWSAWIAWAICVVLAVGLVRPTASLTDRGAA